MTTLSTWWAALSWSHAALVLLLIVIAITVLGIAIGKCCAINEPTPKPRPYVIDYSAAREKAIAWLGPERYLLGKPINRRSAQ